ncbi:MAG: GNAT family N-acetyltransferase [Dehalococcoidia bacterium]|nr:GNAT family N-acetyltransferase [Dehalococcoidia bacterium]
MDLICRAARRSDFAEIITLLERCFDEAAPGFFAAQTGHDSTFRLRHARVAVIDGRIAGYVRIFARRMVVAGLAVVAGGIGSVATRPDLQGRGIATALLEDAVARMRQERMEVSFLFTGIPAFYERLGYQILRQPEITLPRATARSGGASLYAVRPAAAGDLPRLLAIYRMATGDATGAIIRTPRGWTDAQHWLDERPALVATRGGVVVAYIRSRCRDFGHQILEAECAPDHADALSALVRAVAQETCSCDALVASVPTTHRLASLLRRLPEARETTDVRHPMMLRLLIDDPDITTAFARATIYFWNSDRI